MDQTVEQPVVVRDAFLQAPAGPGCGESSRPYALSASCSTRSHGARHGACR